MSKDSASRFDGNADRYLKSEIHRDSPTIRRLHQFVEPRASWAVCDVACGVGYLGLSFAGSVARIVGVDPAPKMLEAFAAQARERGVAVECVSSYAESIALPDASFDLAMARLAPHHFADVPAAMREMARIVKPGGFVAVIDIVGEEDPEVDALNHRLELLHDPTHVRSYRAGEWRRFLESAGLVVEVLELSCERPQGVSIATWCLTTKPGPENERAICAELAAAPASSLRALGIRSEAGEYFVTSRSLLAVARKP